MGDGEIEIEKCIGVRVFFFLCVCVQGYVHVDVRTCVHACMESICNMQTPAN